MFIPGLSAHAQSRLRDRYGILKTSDLMRFSNQVLGKEDVDWVPFIVNGTSSFGTECHGRKVLWISGGQSVEVPCVVTEHEFTKSPIVVTVLGDGMDVFLPTPADEVVQTPSELAAQNTALSLRNEELQEQVDQRTRETLTLNSSLQDALGELSVLRSQVERLQGDLEEADISLRTLRVELTKFETLKAGLAIFKELLK